MTTFPALTPSSRVFTPGEYPATAFNGYSGAQNRVRHSNVFLASQLRLTFKAASEADMLTIWRHYAGTQGNYESFELSPEALSDVSSTDYVPGVYRWIYAGPGSVEDLPCGGHNISLTLETVPPVAASVVGSRFRINLLLATGGAASTDTSGIAGVIELGLMAGDALEAQNGLSESIELGLTTGEAFGGITGLHESIELVLDAGAAASTSGISGVLDLALTTGPGSVASAPGINEAIDLVLVGGVADSGTLVNPIPALSPVLWYDFDDEATVTLSGTTITQIDDKGTRGWDLTKSTTGPVQATWTNNSRKCVDWGSSEHSNYLRNVSVTNTDIAEAYIVLDASFGSTFPDFNGLISGTVNPFYLAGSPGTDGFWGNSSFNAVYLNGGNSNSIGAVLPTINSPALMRAKNLNDSAASTADGFQIGMDRNNAGRGWYGLIAEVVCFSSVLSSTDRDAVEAWLADKWDISLA